MKYIAPEMEIKALEVEDIIMSTTGEGNQGGVGAGGEIELPGDEV